jgi:hypothetical protein
MAKELEASYVCVVCAESVRASMSSECNWCNGRYHLNQRNDVVAKDCGRVWIDEQYMALQFACDNCLNPPAEQRPWTRSASDARASRPRRYRRRA